MNIVMEDCQILRIFLWFYENAEESLFKIELYSAFPACLPKFRCCRYLVVKEQINFSPQSLKLMVRNKCRDLCNFEWD